jgi:hypothetical protein
MSQMQQSNFPIPDIIFTGYMPLFKKRRGRASSFSAIVYFLHEHAKSNRSGGYHRSAIQITRKAMCKAMGISDKGADLCLEELQHFDLIRYVERMERPKESHSLTIYSPMFEKDFDEKAFEEDFNKRFAELKG